VYTRIVVRKELLCFLLIKNLKLLNERRDVAVLWTVCMCVFYLAHSLGWEPSISK